MWLLKSQELGQNAPFTAGRVKIWDYQCTVSTAEILKVMEVAELNLKNQLFQQVCI